jgi:hypothetical protein
MCTHIAHRVRLVQRRPFFGCGVLERIVPNVGTYATSKVHAFFYKPPSAANSGG